MKKIFSILSKSKLSIFIIIILLLLQANCDLALPDYTAKIVNIGIQQNGIENTTIEVIRESEFNKLVIFTNESEDKIIFQNYKLITKENKEYLKKYPLLKKENLYILKSKKDISKTIKKPLLLVSLFESKDPKTLSMMNNMIKNIPNNMDIFMIFKNMNDNQINGIVNQIDSKLSKLSDSMTTQMTISKIKSEYEIIGVSTNNIQLSYIANLGIRMILLAFLIMALTITTTYLSSKVGALFAADLRSKVVKKVMGYSNKEFEEISTSSLITRSTNDITQIQTLVIMTLRIVIYAPLLGFGALGKVSGSSISWVIGVAVLTILSIIITLFVVAMPKFKMLQKLIDKLNLVSREILTGLPVIRAFATEKHEEDKFDKANIDLTKTNLFVNRVMTIMMPTMMFVMNAIAILIVYAGAFKVDAGVMQVGDLFAFISYTMQIIISFLMISMMSIILPRSWVSVKRIAEVFDKETSIIETNEPLKFDKKLKGTVEFKDVYFRYPDALEDVLENISFKATKGTTTALIGSTGSGKSTLINLIPRFFDVTGGKILIDGVNIKDVKLKNLRSIIGFVPQKGILFSGTIESNIKFGNSKLSKKEIDKVAQISQALEFIESKEDKYNSLISEGGTNVSGGQKQRLAIARAIAINPEIFIFDDSFSALDYKTDSNLRKMIKKELKDSTIFIVAQRISTVIDADQIIVLDEGNIVGIGTHKELLKNCSVYKEIALSQLSEEELTNE